MKHIELLTTIELINRIRRLISIPQEIRNNTMIDIYLTEFRERDDSSIVQDEDKREIENEVYKLA